MTSQIVALSPERRLKLDRRAHMLAWLTVGYNALEAVVAILAGATAGSIALISFGGDSIVECLSALVIIWQFRGVAEERERRALRLVALSFFALAGYVGVHSIYALLSGAEVESSPVGIGLAVASLVIMPALSFVKRRTGRALGSRAVVADSMQTLLCTYLSAVLLAGLLANSLLGWSWADPIAALVVAGLAIKEGREAWQGDTCACD
jgi:divalent metal cation (Fe/Co/Zn/Cd) transporter